MKKTLHTEAIKNELAGSVFFPGRTQQPPQPEQAQSPFPEQVSPSHTLVTQASKDASKHASTLAQDIDFKGIHKILKFIGKEVLYVRLTQEEKSQVNDIEYTYQRQGIKTSGNEIGRIALNVLLADYKANGAQSILAKLLTELHT